MFTQQLTARVATTIKKMLTPEYVLWVTLSRTTVALLQVTILRPHTAMTSYLLPDVAMTKALPSRVQAHSLMEPLLAKAAAANYKH